MIGALLELLSTVIGALRARSAHRKGRFIGLVHPLQAEFEKLHEDYLGSFRRYRRSIRSLGSSPRDWVRLVDQVRMDGLVSESSRKRVKAFSRDLPESLPRRLRESAEDYCNALDSYSVVWRGSTPQDFISFNPYRMSFSEALGHIAMSKIPTREKRRQALALLEDLVGVLQQRYGEVIERFASIRMSALK